MVGLGISPLECQQAFSAGDLAFWKASGCAGSATNDKLLADTKSSISRNTVILVGSAVAATALIIYFATKTKK